MKTFEEIMDLLGLLILITLTIGFLVNFFLLRYKAKQSETWPFVLGVIIRSDTKYVMNGDISTLKKNIIYEYVVLGKSYKSGKLFFKTFDFDDENYFKKYPMNKQVKVYYNPSKPKEAVLETGIFSGIYFILGLSILFFFITTICLLYLLDYFLEIIHHLFFLPLRAGW